MVGYIVVDFGGLVMLYLKFSLSVDGGNCCLCISDVLVGNVDDKMVVLLSFGW